MREAALNSEIFKYIANDRSLAHETSFPPHLMRWDAETLTAISVAGDGPGDGPLPIPYPCDDPRRVLIVNYDPSLLYLADGSGLRDNSFVRTSSSHPSRRLTRLPLVLSVFAAFLTIVGRISLRLATTCTCLRVSFISLSRRTHFSTHLRREIQLWTPVSMSVFTLFLFRRPLSASLAC